MGKTFNIQSQVTPKLMAGSGKNKLIQDFMLVLIACKFDEDPIKTEGAIVSTSFSLLYVYGKNVRHSRTSNSKAICQIWPKIKLVQDFMPFLVISKSKKVL